jgi:hypothetical protein
MIQHGSEHPVPEVAADSKAHVTLPVVVVNVVFLYCLQELRRRLPEMSEVMSLLVDQVPKQEACDVRVREVRWSRQFHRGDHEGVKDRT